nr:hypothetical protein Iba_chr03cCG5130 [Ipomoea batatas]
MPCLIITTSYASSSPSHVRSRRTRRTSIAVEEGVAKEMQRMNPRDGAGGGVLQLLVNQPNQNCGEEDAYGVVSARHID